MIGYLRIALPTISIIYFLWIARKRRLFLLAIPFLLFMGNSVMFRNLPIRVFYIPGSVDSNLRLFIWLFLIWFVCTDKMKKNITVNIKSHLSIEELPIWGILVFTIFHLIIGFVSPGNLNILLSNATPMIYMTLGYFMIKQIVLYASRSTVFHFLKVFAILSTITSILFIVHQGIGIRIYPYQEYLEKLFYGSVVTRTFGFISPLLVFSLCYGLATMNDTSVSKVIVIINVIAILVTYTRMLIILMLVAIVLMLILNTFKSANRISIMKNFALSALLLVLAVFLFSYFLPNKYKYLMTRIQEVTDVYSESEKAGIINITEVGNIQVRQNKFNDVFAKFSYVQQYVGLGFSQNSAGNTVLFSDVSDSEWIGTVKYFGLSGIILFVLLQLGFFAKGINMYFSRNPETSKIGIMFALVILLGFLNCL